MAVTRICRIPGCTRPHIAKDLCTMHYQRQQHGVPMDYKGRGVASEMRAFLDAAIASDTDECITWPWNTARGYATWPMRPGKPMMLSHEVCEARHGPRPSKAHVAAHNCNRGAFACINPKHVRWATQRDNNQDKYAYGTMMMGEAVPWSKLTEENVREIRANGKNASYPAIGRRYGVSRSTIMDVLNFATWKHVL